MKRVLLVLGVTIVVALGVVAAAVFKEEQVDTFVPPTFAPVQATSAFSVDTPLLSPTPDPTPLPSGVTPAPAVALRDPSQVDCAIEPHFCTPKHKMSVEGGELSDPLTREPKPSSEEALTIQMSSQIRREDRLPAATGDEVGSLRVEITIANETKDAFAFAERKVLLTILRDGQPFAELKTTGAGFRLAPTGRATATFEQPITQDGRYTWTARTWYYRES